LVRAPYNDPLRGTGLRVLVVDDEKNIRTTLSVCLQGLPPAAVQVAILLQIEFRPLQRYDLWSRIPPTQGGTGDPIRRGEFPPVRAERPGPRNRAIREPEPVS
jgi:hypothetical protein